MLFSVVATAIRHSNTHLSWRASSHTAARMVPASVHRAPGRAVASEGHGAWPQVRSVPIPLHFFPSLPLSIPPSLHTLPPRSVTPAWVPSWGSAAAHTRQPGIATDPGPTRGQKLAVAHARQPQIHGTHMEQQGLRAAVGSPGGPGPSSTSATPWP